MKNCTYRFFTIGIIFLNTFAFGQSVGINTTGANPNPSAMLDIDNTEKGLLIPRVSITDASVATPITSPATSLIVYNTNASITNGDGLGYYYWDGTKWTKILDENSTADDWKLLGNAGTNPATNFLGTTDAQDLVFRTNNTENVRINTSGNVDIGAFLDDARIYARILNTDLTTNYGLYVYHDGGITSGTTYGTRTLNYSSTSGTKYGLYNYTNSEGTGARYGFYNATYLNSASTSPGYGIRNYLSTYGTATQYGIYNYVTSSSATGIHYGQRNYVYLATGNTNEAYGEYTYLDYSSGERYGEYKQMNSNSAYDGDVYGDYNRLQGTGDGTNYGVYNSIEKTGTGTTYGSYNQVNATAVGIVYGFYNNFENTSSNAKYGLRNQFANVAGVKYGVHTYIPDGTSSSTIYGIYNQFYADNNSTIYGLRNYLYYMDGTGSKYGSYNYLYNNNGAQYGTRNYVYGKSTSSSTQYGVYSYVNSAGTGTHYALFADAPGGTNDFAAVFNAGHVVANEIGGNYDFRVEGDTETNLLMVDASADNVGIGTATPTYKLDVYNSSTADPTYIYRGRNGTAVGTRTQIGSVEYFQDFSSTIDFSGGSNFGINMNASAAYDLQLAINSAAKPGSNVWTVASDERLKEDIHPFKDGLETIREIEPVYYKYNGKANIKEDHYFVGVIAQDLEEVAPYMVGSFESAPGDIPFEEQEAATETYKSVDNGAMTYIAINAIQELDEKQSITEKIVKNISDFGIAEISGDETFVSFNEDFKSMLEGLPVVTVTPLNDQIVLTIVSQTKEGFIVKSSNSVGVNFNWVAMAKVNEKVFINKNDYTPEEREEMLSKIKAEKAEINYEAEYDEIEVRKQEEINESKARADQDKLGEQAQEAGKLDPKEEEEMNQLMKEMQSTKKDAEAAAKSAEKSKLTQPEENPANQGAFEEPLGTK